MSCSLVRSLSSVAILCVLVAGCGSKDAYELDLPTAEMYATRGADAAPAHNDMSGGAEDGLPGEGAATTPEGFDRKIIYSADVELVVEDFSGVPDQVVELVKKYGGYIADSNLSGTAGTNRRATWRIRVPVARFEEFVNASKGLGELVRAGTSSQDVSEEYFDVEARIRNKTKEEERLLKLLEERPGDLEDVIAIERELSRVREELERMQGRMRVLADLTSLTTVSLTIQEIRDYQPPQAPTFTTRIRRAFQESLSGIKSTGENLAIATVAIAPWLVVFGVVLVPIVYGLRARWRQRKLRGATAPSATATLDQ